MELSKPWGEHTPTLRRPSTISTQNNVYSPTGHPILSDIAVHQVGSLHGNAPLLPAELPAGRRQRIANTPLWTYPRAPLDAIVWLKRVINYSS
ncbi:hypothetical protein [Paraburkholderia aspalathi]|uniref:hypothetical protein n=1 Tax=Paraburkholderia aspalathi TaxID=1324617 RepID=UPI0038BC7FF3